MAVFWSASPLFRCVGTRSFDAAAGALLLSSFSPSSGAILVQFGPLLVQFRRHLKSGPTTFPHSRSVLRLALSLYLSPPGFFASLSRLPFSGGRVGATRGVILSTLNASLSIAFPLGWSLLFPRRRCGYSPSCNGVA